MKESLALAFDFLKLSDQEMAAFLNDWKVVKEIKRKETLVSVGQKDLHVYFVLEGTFRIYYPTTEGEQVIGFGYPNTFLVEIYSMLRNEPSKFEVEAIKKSKIIGIHKDQFSFWMERLPQLAEFWRQSSIDALFGQIEREIDLMTTSPQERYQRVYDRSPHVFQLIPAKFIASYLRMTPETLSRLQKS